MFREYLLKGLRCQHGEESFCKKVSAKPAVIFLMWPVSFFATLFFAGLFSLFFVLLAGEALAGNDAVDPPLQGTASFSFGLLSGEAGEYVYSGGVDASELTWETKPLYFIEWQAGGVFRGWGEVSLRYRYGFAGRSGKMTDYDWDWPYPGSYTLSRHDNFIHYYHEAEISTLLRRPLSSCWKFAGGFSFLMMALQMEGRDGSVIEDDVETVVLEGPVIRYTQVYRILPLIVRFTCLPAGWLSLETVFAYTPFFFCSATDIHYLRDKKYSDNVVFGHFLRGMVSVEVAFTSRIALFVSGALRWVPETRGDTAVYSLSTGTLESKSRNTGGVSLFQAEASLGIRLHSGQAR